MSPGAVPPSQLCSPALAGESRGQTLPKLCLKEKKKKN